VGPSQAGELGKWWSQGLHSRYICIHPFEFLRIFGYLIDFSDVWTVRMDVGYYLNTNSVVCVAWLVTSN